MLPETQTAEASARGWHEGLLAGFDLETTGPDPETARIVTATVLQRGRTESSLLWLVNPGVDIPAEATAVHGVSTEDAQHGRNAAEAIAEIADELWRIFSAGIPLVIYNAPYDLTVMDRETRRHGLQPFGDLYAATDAVVIDPFILDKHLDRYRKGKRTLSATCAHYGVALTEAHNSDADTLAAMRVAWKIAVQNPQIAKSGPAALQSLQARACAAQAAGFQDYLRRQGSTEVIDGSWPLKAFPAAGGV